MPEANARRLESDDGPDPRAAAAHLRLLPGEPPSGPPPPGVESRARSTGGRPAAGRPAGRPHPRSRIRPEAREASPVLERNEARLAAAAAPRTIVVTGQRTPATRTATQSGRTASVGRAPELGRAGARPDRVALWAVGLGLLMAFMAAATAEAAAPFAPTATPPVTATR